jgi:secondary thiamine-phosphate synthase enzyme
VFYNFEVKTIRQTELIDITRKVQSIIEKRAIRDGVCYVFIPHTTAAITINENADPSVLRDIQMAINQVIPFQGPYQHMEGNSPAHIKSSLFGCSLAILVDAGKLVLGTWQGIFLCEFDGPRDRKVYVKVLEG